MLEPAIIIHVQSPSVPGYVKEIVGELWGNYELPNDGFVEFSMDPEGDDAQNYPHLYDYLSTCGLSVGGRYYLHYWW